MPYIFHVESYINLTSMHVTFMNRYFRKGILNILITIGGPNFLVEPHNKVVVQGSMVMMHCVAEGHPQPRLSWRWDSGTERKQLTSEGRVTILPNNTLRSGSSQPIKLLLNSSDLEIFMYCL